MSEPRVGFDAGRSVACVLVLRSESETTMSFVIDENGIEIPGSRQVSNRYANTTDLPAPDSFRIENLPAVVHQPR